MFLHYGSRQYTPEQYLAAKARGDLGAQVHADGSLTLRSGEVVSPIAAERAKKAIDATQEYNDAYEKGTSTPKTTEEFAAPETLADPTLPETTETPDATEEVQPFTLEELQAQAKEKGIRGYHLYSYEKLLETLYPQK